ncbi:MAG: nucleotidyltransferase family protein [Deltaproteobacteria bacterium]
MTGIEAFLISPEAPLLSAMRQMGATGSQILFVTDEALKLIGAVTNGDIRRALINTGDGFQSPVSKIMFQKPRFVYRHEPDFQKKAGDLILQKRLLAIPILNEERKITDILFWHDFFGKSQIETKPKIPLTTPVVIMCGGKGTRMDPLTRILPKPLIPIGNKPMVEKIMDTFHAFNFHHFILVLNYKKEFVKNYFKENQMPYEVSWVEEDEYMGTAGGLSLLKDKMKETFIVTNCDIILQANFKDILAWHKKEKAALSLVGHHKEMVVPYGVLEIRDGRLKSINEKPKYDFIVNSGIYLIEPEILNLIPEKTFLDMNHLIERVGRERKVSVYPTSDHWFDLGQWSEYNANLWLLHRTSVEEEKDLRTDA